MLKNYLTITLRVLLRIKVSTLVNIFGLALGITAFLFLLEYVSLEQSANRFHVQLPQMHSLLCADKTGKTWAQVEPAWPPLAAERLPEVADFCRFGDGIAQGIVQSVERDLSFREEKIGYAEGNFFSFFSFPLRAGRAEAFRQPDVLFLSESTARRYFGSEAAVGRSLRVFNQFGNRNFTVGGVFGDMGENSDIRYDIALSLETLKNPANLNGNTWAALDGFENQYIHAMFRLQPGADARVFEQKMNALRREIRPKNDATTFRTQPFAEMRLARSLSDTLHHTGDVRYVLMLVALACLILGIAWFNYVNLSTAQAWKRAGEVGIRKVVGASRRAVVAQFAGEALLVNLAGFAGALLLTTGLQPYFNDLIGKQLSLAVLCGSSVWAWGLGVLFVGSLVSGAWAAFSISGFNPVDIFRGKSGAGQGGGVLLRKTLVVSQFAVSVALILFSVLIYRQLRFMQTKNLGMRPEQVLVVAGPEVGRDSSYSSRRAAFWQAVGEQSFVNEYCLSGCVPGRSFNFNAEGFVAPQSKAGDENKSYAIALVDDRYLKTYGIELAAGRNCNALECAAAWNDKTGILVNERAAAQLGFASPEEALATPLRWQERTLNIVGVVRDYHHSGVQKAIEPIIFVPQNNSAWFSMRLTGGDFPAKIGALEKFYKASFPGNPFEYFFADDNFNEQYAAERRYGLLFALASVWAIFIACLGLFGLSTFMVENRTKEIGIRKVLGASVLGVSNLLVLDFVKLVALGIVVASPVAWFFMRRWLSDFAEPVDIQWWMFAAAGGAALGVACLTVGFQSVKAALANPVKSLRSE